MTGNRGPLVPYEICPGCSADSANNYFDRSLCPEPCGKMHQRCRECGLAQDECGWEPDAQVVAYFNHLYELKDRKRKPRKWSRSYLYDHSRANEWPLWVSWLLAPSKKHRQIVRDTIRLRGQGFHV